MLCCPAILFPPDTNELSCCLVPDPLINASGATPDKALRDAATIFIELLNNMACKGELLLSRYTTAAEDVELGGGTLVLLTAHLSSLAA